MKKILTAIFVLFISISLAACSCDKDDYVKSDPKTFSNNNFTITATVDYIQSDEYGKDVLVLEGLNGESIVAYYDYGNVTMNVDNTTLDQFTQNVIALSYFSIDHDDIKEININKSEGYTNTVAKYFVVNENKGAGNGIDIPEREKFNINYTNLFEEGSYKWIVITAKVENAFAVVYIGGGLSTFDKKYDEYLSYAESLLIKDVEEKNSNFEQLLSSETKQTNVEFWSDITGFNMQIPTNFIYYETGVDYTANVGNINIVKNGLTYGALSLYGYGDNWDSIESYSIVRADLGKIDEGYDINQYMVYVGANRYLGVYYKSVSISEDFEYGPGAVCEDLYFQFYVNNRTYVLSVSIRATFEGDVSSDSYDEYKWHSSDSLEINRYLANMEEKVFSWIQTIELV